MNKETPQIRYTRIWQSVRVAFGSPTGEHIHSAWQLLPLPATQWMRDQERQMTSFMVGRKIMSQELLRAQDAKTLAAR